MKRQGFLDFRTGLGLVAAIVSLFAQRVAAEPTQVTTTNGPVIGQVADGVLSFKGIPYAAPPVGPLRWRPTQPPKSWTTPRAAKAFSPACPQSFAQSARFTEPTSEDCLYLNVFAPAKPSPKPLPVMVWIYGGSWTNGSGSRPLYDGSAFARDGVILVSFNYRLGALGFFAHPLLTAEAGPTDPLFAYGHLDQVAALKWVQANIAAFGGDPANVTVFGESAGGGSLLALLTLPQAKGLFARAIAESAPAVVVPKSLNMAEKSGASYLAMKGVLATATLEDLRKLPADQLVGDYDATPIVDGRLQKETYLSALKGGRATIVPMIIGTNSDEGSLVAYYAKLPDQMMFLFRAKLDAMRGLYGLPSTDDKTLGRQLFADTVFGAPSRLIAETISQTAPAYLYRFAYLPEEDRAQGSSPQIGVRHGGELEFVFASLGRGWIKSPSPNDHQISDQVHACWVAFAKTGAPCPVWPAYQRSNDQTLVIDPSGLHAESGYRKPVYDAVLATVLPGG